MLKLSDSDLAKLFFCNFLNLIRGDNSNNIHYNFFMVEQCIFNQTKNLYIYFAGLGKKLMIFNELNQNLKNSLLSNESLITILNSHLKKDIL